MVHGRRTPKLHARPPTLSVVGGLLTFAAPLILAFLGRAQANGELNAGALGGVLRAEAPNLQAYLPARLFSSLGGPAAALQRGLVSIPPGYREAEGGQGGGIAQDRGA